MAVTRILASALFAAALAASGVARAETITLECQIEYTVRTTDMGWIRDSELVRIDLDARTLSVTDAVAMFPDEADTPCEITERIISCGARPDDYVPTRTINRYTGAFEMSYHDYRSFRSGMCRPVSQQF